VSGGVDTKIEMGQVRVVGEKVGRPGTITPAVERELFDQVAEGTLMREASRRIGVEYRSLMRLGGEDRQRVSSASRAREAGVEANLEEVEELLRGANNKNISVVRELAHHLRWKASKLKPRNYVDRVSAEVSEPAANRWGWWWR
jgi:hypothetical protein